MEWKLPWRHCQIILRALYIGVITIILQEAGACSFINYCTCRFDLIIKSCTLKKKGLEKEYCAFCFHIVTREHYVSVTGQINIRFWRLRTSGMYRKSGKYCRIHRKNTKAYRKIIILRKVVISSCLRYDVFSGKRSKLSELHSMRSLSWSIYDIFWI